MHKIFIHKCNNKEKILDPPVSKSVSNAFVELHKKGLIYRDNKIVNWSAKMKNYNYQ